MATVTIRNLSDEVVEALKARARRNSRSMEAEVRDALTRLVAHENGDTSGLEEMLEQRYGPRRWYAHGGEINAWLDAHLAAEDDQRVAREWLAEYNARPYDEEPLQDPWEVAERQLKDLRARQKAQKNT